MHGISLSLHETKAKPRLNVNNKDAIGVNGDISRSKLVIFHVNQIHTIFDVKFQNKVINKCYYTCIIALDNSLIIA